jgi:hypothetical protein
LVEVMNQCKVDDALIGGLGMAIRGILAANRGALDLDWVRREWSELAPPDDTTAGEFERLVREVYDRI